MFADILKAINESGFPSAMAIALLLMLREQMKHCRDNTVPRKVFESEQAQHREQHKESRKVRDKQSESIDNLDASVQKMLGILKGMGHG